MKKQVSILVLFVILVLACSGVAPTVSVPAEPTAGATASPEGEAQPTVSVATAVPQAGSFTVLGILNRDSTQAAQSPSLGLGTISADTPPGLWVSWAENSSGSVRQIFVSDLVGEAFQARGASLNIHTNVIGDFPSITFAGENRLVPWVAWVEPSPGFDNVPQIFASRFNASTGLWQQAGQDRGGGEASLNLHTDQPASRPVIFSGSGDPAAPPVPWVAWEEHSVNSSFIQIFVAKGVKDDSGDPAVIGGFRWETVGLVKEDGLQTLNVDRFRDSLRPSGVFAETNNSVPWVTWHEAGRDRPSRIFTARGVADANAPGGFKWINVPACQPNDETTCTLNVNPLKDAKDASMTAGSLTSGEAAVPWLAWLEIGPTGKWQIIVSRLDTTTRNNFLGVGASLNVDQNQDAQAPYITFVGNVPYVGWLEDDGTGKLRVHVRHLASDPQTGTWVLDSPPQGFNQNPDLTATGPFNAAALDNTLFLTWVEGDPATSNSQVIVGALRAGGQP
jgi:hypothetical protein